MENNENKLICSKCETSCCKQHPCAVFPEDVKPFTLANIVNMLKGNYSINSWDGDVGKYDELGCVYYIMPKVKSQKQIVTSSWGGECILLTDKGCKLSWEQRPTGGKLLIPSETRCKPDIPDNLSDKEYACIAWRPHQNLLIEAISIINEHRDK